MSAADTDERRDELSREWQNDEACTGRLRAYCKSDVTAAVIVTTGLKSATDAAAAALRTASESRNDEHLSYDSSNLTLLGLTLIRGVRYYTDKRGED